MAPIARALLAAGLSVTLVAAQGSTDDLRTARLAATGKLWATVKYFHPALGESNPAEWDQALLETIPKVEVATTRDEYVAALQQMVERLQDSVTRIEEERPEPPGPTLGFASVELRSGILLVTSGRVSGDPVDSSDAVRKHLSAASAVIFDLRQGAVHGWLWDLQSVPLSKDPLAFPAHRFRVHMGNVTPRGAEGSPFFSGILTRAAPVTRRPTAGLDKRVVFLVNRSEQVPLLAAALQAIDRGYIVAEQPIDDRAIARHGFARHYRMPLGEGLVAFVRTSEMLHADGTVGLQADQVVKGDGLDAAFEAAFGRGPRVQRSAAPSGYQTKVAEQLYADTTYPSRPLRLLGAFRIWAVFEWLYPYRNLIDGDWDAVLREALPKIAAARDARQYHLSIAEMVAKVGDSHAGIDSSVMTDFWGPAAPALALRPIEGKAVIVGTTDASAAALGAEVGDVILAVDGQPAEQRLNALSRYISASTPQALRRDAVNRLLRGADGSSAHILVRKRDGSEREITLPRAKQLLPLSWAPITTHVFQKLPNNLGYIDLRLLQNHEVDRVFEQLRASAAIIFDMRGYPNNTRLNVASKLTDRSEIQAASIYMPLLFEPGTQSRQELRSTLRLTPAPDRYRGKTVMLIDDRAQSQSEATAQLLRAVHATVFVGSATTGANGEGSNFPVPGGIGVGMTGTGVTKRDGSQLQRIGVLPDIEVHPTIAGVRAGRDEVLERAVAYLLSGK